MMRPTCDAQLKPLLYLTSGVDPHVLQAAVRLAVDLAWRGHEGKKIGTMFVIGDEVEVMRRSHSLVLDPLAGHVRNIQDPEMEGTIRELALLDGAFVVSATGVVLSAGRCMEVLAEGIDVPMGLGTRHRAAASVTKATQALAVVVSESSTVRLFYDGAVVDELTPGGEWPTPTEFRKQRRRPARRAGRLGQEFTASR